MPREIDVLSHVHNVEDYPFGPYKHSHPILSNVPTFHLSAMMVEALLRKYWNKRKRDPFDRDLVRYVDS